MGVLELNQFFSRLLTRRPAAAVVTWESRAALEAFTLRLPDAVASSSPGAAVSEIVGGDLDSTTFAEVLAAQLTEWNAGNRVLLIREIEALATKAGRILNGFRERLASFTAVGKFSITPWFGWRAFGAQPHVGPLWQTGKSAGRW